MRVLPLLASALLLIVLCSCAERRIERYYSTTNSPLTLAPEMRWQVLYYKQSMRHMYATLRVTNTGSQPLLIRRTGADAATFTLLVEGTSVPSDPPTRASWTPWDGIVELTDAQVAKQEIAPGATADFTLRWEFPTTTSTYLFAWTVRIAGLLRDGKVLPDVAIQVPVEVEESNDGPREGYRPTRPSSRWQ